MSRWLSFMTCALVAGTVLAAEPTPPADPMSAWRPPRLSSEAKDRREIAALLQRMEEAGKKGDLEAAASLVDFPVLMGTDDSRGEGSAETWSRERWLEVMKPFYAKPMDMKETHRPTISVLTDSLATVVDRATFTMGGKTVTTRSATLLVRKDGQWKVKAVVEGGWGDAMGAMAGAAAGSGPSPSGTGSAEPRQKP